MDAKILENPSGASGPTVREWSAARGRTSRVRRDIPPRSIGSRSASGGTTAAAIDSR